MATNDAKHEVIRAFLKREYAQAGKFHTAGGVIYSYAMPLVELTHAPGEAGPDSLPLWLFKYEVGSKGPSVTTTQHMRFLEHALPNAYLHGDPAKGPTMAEVAGWTHPKPPTAQQRRAGADRFIKDVDAFLEDIVARYQHTADLALTHFVKPVCDRYGYRFVSGMGTYFFDNPKAQSHDSRWPAHEDPDDKFGLRDVFRVLDHGVEVHGEHWPLGLWLNSYPHTEDTYAT